MSILFEKGLHFYRVYFVTGPPQEGDWMCAIWRDGFKLRGKYRFRYYRDDKTHDSDDVKNWYSMEADYGGEASVSKMLVAFETIAKLIALRAGGGVETVICDCDGEEAARKVMAQPWAHVQTSGKGGSA